MGSIQSYCPHTLFILQDIDPAEYNDKTGIWKFQMADGRCDSCGEKIRLIKKKCKEHNIEHYWEYFDKTYCQHDVIMIRQKKRDLATNRYNGRSECVACLTSIPVYMTFMVDKKDGKETDLQISEWDVDKKKLQLEQEEKANKVNKK